MKKVNKKSGSSENSNATDQTPTLNSKEEAPEQTVVNTGAVSDLDTDNASDRTFSEAESSRSSSQPSSGPAEAASKKSLSKPSQKKAKAANKPTSRSTNIANKRKSKSGSTADPEVLPFPDDFPDISENNINDTVADSANETSDSPSSPSFSLSPSQSPVNQYTYQSSDRIAIFIDGSNLFYAASHLNIEVDYRRLLTSLVRGRRLLRAYFYTGVDPQNEKQRGFLLWLNRHGHRVVSKELTHLPDGSRKANMHVEMAVDMMRISEYCPNITLLGGDGNLAYALQVLSQRGIFIEVVSLQSMTSDSLIDLADSYTDLADLRDSIKR